MQTPDTIPHPASADRTPQRFALANGRVVKVERMHSQRTYPSLLIGLPIEQVNDGITHDLLDRAMNMFKCSAVCLPPKFDEQGLMPPVAMTALLTSDAPVRNGDGSQLVVIWFREELPSESAVIESVPAALRDLKWNDYAEDSHF
ncbi:MAG TPA: hypothetical protein VFS42_01865 [Burkholderiaceae bacterium]|nr:hypothetical protein [Burkholderiaceae bacterium]